MATILLRNFDQMKITKDDPAGKENVISWDVLMTS